MKYTTENIKRLVLKIFDDELLNTTNYRKLRLSIRLKDADETTIEINKKNGYYAMCIEGEDTNVLPENILQKLEPVNVSNFPCLKFTTRSQFEEIVNNLLPNEVDWIGFYHDAFETEEPFGRHQKNISYFDYEVSTRNRGVYNEHIDPDIKDMVQIYTGVNKFIPKLKTEANWAKMRRKARLEGHPNMLTLQSEWDKIHDPTEWKFGKKKRSGKKSAKGRSSLSSSGAPKMSATAFDKTGKLYMKGTNGKYFTITPVGETHGRNVRWRWILSPHQTGIRKDKIYQRYPKGTKFGKRKRNDALQRVNMEIKFLSK
jgi:hypothetical protein